MTHSNELYTSVVQITAEYLGPAAQRFIDRQIQHHLNKRPSELTAADMKKLIEWVRLAFSILTEDKSIINEYTKRLKEAAKQIQKQAA